MLRGVTEELRSYIEAISPADTTLELAYETAEEFGLSAPDIHIGQLLSTLAATSKAQGAIAITPASAVVGYFLLQGMNSQGTLTCIDPEPEYHRRSAEIFRNASFSPTRVRFLPSRPLDVMGRLAKKSYQIIYGEVSPIDARALISASLPLLSAGGSVIIPDILLDGTPSDQTRRDRETVAARDLQDYLNSLESVQVTRLPLGAGLVIVTVQ
ncbi:O-methyltransferase [Corynebacterium sp. ES2794-CONJ1]|uniref:O-methyltransferase n=1 Tax=Corynebacterium sp. ES2794-CONJ1 TaxID=2980553 RepID=UPI0021D8717C|nr:O-methyltransferase [Corynebacterium sp. ES2794-CONJ1]MCU9519266.1 O-methyltransferase [Corynebacterium sp. ES2794-CONJ1]